MKSRTNFVIVLRPTIAFGSGHNVYYYSKVGERSYVYNCRTREIKCTHLWVSKIDSGKDAVRKKVTDSLVKACLLPRVEGPVVGV